MAASKKTKPIEVNDELEPMLTRLKLTAIRDQLDTLLDPPSGPEHLNRRTCTDGASASAPAAMTNAAVRSGKARSLRGMVLSDHFGTAPRHPSFTLMTRSAFPICSAAVRPGAERFIPDV